MKKTGYLEGVCPKIVKCKTDQSEKSHFEVRLPFHYSAVPIQYRCQIARVKRKEFGKFPIVLHEEQKS
jgi:hypothetical protein